MTDLIESIRAEASSPLPEPVARMTEIARQRFGAKVDAVLFYGSCRRRDEALTRSAP